MSFLSINKHIVIFIWRLLVYILIIIFFNKEIDYFLKLQCLLKKDNFVHKFAKEKKRKYYKLKLITKIATYVFFITTFIQLRTYLVFLGVFNFFGAKLDSTQALFHSCQAFPNVFDHINIHFYKFPYIVCQVSKHTTI
jgi:hypothetical protein